MAQPKGSITAIKALKARLYVQHMAESANGIPVGSFAVEYKGTVVGGSSIQGVLRLGQALGGLKMSQCGFRLPAVSELPFPEPQMQAGRPRRGQTRGSQLLAPRGDLGLGNGISHLTRVVQMGQRHRQVESDSVQRRCGTLYLADLLVGVEMGLSVALHLLHMLRLRLHLGGEGRRHPGAMRLGFVGLGQMSGDCRWCHCERPDHAQGQ